MLLYSRKKVRYRRDGYCWKKRKDGKTTREDHMKLKVQGTEVSLQTYTHSIHGRQHVCEQMLRKSTWSFFFFSLLSLVFPFLLMCLNTHTPNLPCTAWGARSFPFYASKIKSISSPDESRILSFTSLSFVGSKEYGWVNCCWPCLWWKLASSEQSVKWATVSTLFFTQTTAFSFLPSLSPLLSLYFKCFTTDLVKGFVSLLAQSSFAFLLIHGL